MRDERLVWRLRIIRQARLKEILSFGFAFVGLGTFMVWMAVALLGLVLR